MEHDEAEIWPDDPDGQVLRRMQAKGFDFSIPHTVDFSVDFERWPPDPKAISKIQKKYPNATEYIDAESSRGNIVVKIDSILSYQFVVNTQSKLTDLVSEFDGWCDSWGVLY